MTAPVFSPADILLPETVTDKWSVVACDQFTARRDYWDRVDKAVGDAPSTLRMILPEAYLGLDGEAERAAAIHSAMERYLTGGVFRTVPDSFVYVERGTSAGVRRGLVGAIDLESYDFDPASSAPVRASENTVVSRLPARVEVRRRAALELPHIMALIEDPEKTVIEPLSEKAASMSLLYDVELMEGGGHITGRRVSGADADAVSRALNALFGSKPVQIIVGDGNHSLAAAKRYWDEIKPSIPEGERASHPARFALAEVNNVYDEAIRFEAIHRVVFGCGGMRFVERFSALAAKTQGNTEYAVRWACGGFEGETKVRAQSVGGLIAAVQEMLDSAAAETGGDIDYIHGEDAARDLARSPENACFLLPAMGKGDFFATVEKGGLFPKKSFSIGHAEDKRYYMECRKIR